FERARTEATPTIFVAADGYQQASASLPPPIDGVRTVVFDLRPGFELVATVHGPRVSGLSALRWAEDAQRWRIEGPQNYGLDKESNSVRFTGLPAGRYRAQTDFGQESEEVTLDAAHPSASVRIEAAPVVRLAGRVEGPRDMDPGLVRIALRIGD